MPKQKLVKAWQEWRAILPVACIFNVIASAISTKGIIATPQGLVFFIINNALLILAISKAQKDPRWRITPAVVGEKKEGGKNTFFLAEALVSICLLAATLCAYYSQTPALAYPLMLAGVIGLGLLWLAVSFIPLANLVD